MVRALSANITCEGSYTWTDEVIVDQGFSKFFPRGTLQGLRSLTLQQTKFCGTQSENHCCRQREDCREFFHRGTLGVHEDDDDHHYKTGADVERYMVEHTFAFEMDSTLEILKQDSGRVLQPISSPNGARQRGVSVA